MNAAVCAIMREKKLDAMEERKADFLETYDIHDTFYGNCRRFGIVYSTAYNWIQNDLDYGRMLEKKKKERMAMHIEEVEETFIKVAKGQFYTTTEFFKLGKDADGNAVDLPNGHAVYQMQPSFKHGELILKAHKPELYGSNEQQANGQVTINLNITGGTDNSSLEIKAIDITDMQQHESNALNRGISPDNHIE